MSNSWQELMRLTEGQSFRIERIRISGSDIAIEGDFILPPLTALSIDDQIFVSAFIASHGSIKKMEAIFGISYPTVKNRLNRIAANLDVPRVEIRNVEAPSKKSRILGMLENGEITFDEAMEELK